MLVLEPTMANAASNVAVLDPPATEISNPSLNQVLNQLTHNQTRTLQQLPIVENCCSFDPQGV